ncbi:hypothetical protein [Streptomyces mirabilis]|uniref:hypothetical protein n=1 Tax=Streptomyces mirabilis TaxID=68239 RepID=UPI0033B12F02
MKLSRTPCSSTADDSPVRTLVALQEIADDAGVTPALVSGVPVPAEVLDQTELRENLAEAIVDFWKDANVREPALALERSSDLDDGLLQSLESLGTSAAAGQRDKHVRCSGSELEVPRGGRHATGRGLARAPERRARETGDLLPCFKEL